MIRSDVTHQQNTMSLSTNWRNTTNCLKTSFNFNLMHFPQDLLPCMKSVGMNPNEQVKTRTRPWTVCLKRTSAQPGFSTFWHICFHHIAQLLSVSISLNWAPLGANLFLLSINHLSWSTWPTELQNVNFFTKTTNFKSNQIYPQEKHVNRNNLYIQIKQN